MGSHAKVAAVVGSVSGFIALILIGTLFFFCFKKRGGRPLGRRTSVNAPLMGRSSRTGSRSSNELLGRKSGISALLDPRRIISRPKTNTIQPEMTSWPSGPFARSPSPQRSRSSSAPASTLRERLHGIVGRRNPSIAAAALPTTTRVVSQAPVLPEPVRERRSSVSSLGFGVYIAHPDEENNPFRDPDPEATLQLLNPDQSCNSTPDSTPQRDIRDPMMRTSLERILSLPKQPPPLHRRLTSLSQDPFIDPTEPDDLVRHSLNVSSPTLEALASVDTLRKVAAHNRTRSAASLRSIRPTSHARQVSTASADSGFASASSVSHESGFSSQQSGFPSTQSQTLARLYSQFSNPPSDSSNTNTLSNSTIRLSDLLPPLSTHNSPRSSAAAGFDFGFGEPGPTRPTTEAFTPLPPTFEAFTPRTNRMSDPFDLDKPELLGFPGDKGVGLAMAGAGRTASTRSPTVRALHQKRKSGVLQGWTDGGSTPRA